MGNIVRRWITSFRRNVFVTFVLLKHPVSETITIFFSPFSAVIFLVKFVLLVKTFVAQRCSVQKCSMQLFTLSCEDVAIDNAVEIELTSKIRTRDSRNTDFSVTQECVSLYVDKMRNKVIERFGCDTFFISNNISQPVDASVSLYVDKMRNKVIERFGCDTFFISNNISQPVDASVSLYVDKMRNKVIERFGCDTFFISNNISQPVDASVSLYVDKMRNKVIERFGCDTFFISNNISQPVDASVSLYVDKMRNKVIERFGCDTFFISNNVSQAVDTRKRLNVRCHDQEQEIHGQEPYAHSNIQEPLVQVD